MDRKKTADFAESLSGSYPQRLIKLGENARSFEKLGKIRKVQAGTIIFRPGDKPDYCYYIKSGTVVGYEFTRNGTELDFDVMLENSLFGEAHMLLGETVEIYFKALSDSELVRIEKENFLQAIRDNFELCLVVMRSVSTKFLSAMDDLRQTSSHNATWRICNILLIFSEQYGENYDGKILIRHKLSQQLLSNLLGINRITTVRIIKNLKELGLIEQINGLYCIRDREKIRQYQDEVDICPPNTSAK